MNILGKTGRRFILWMIAGVAACALLGCDSSKSGGGATALPAPAAGCVRVVSWNLEWFPGRSSKPTPQAQAKQVAAVKSALAGLDPGILLVQEVRSEAALAQVLPPEGYNVATTSRFSGAQQLCIAGLLPSESAWFEPWKKAGKNDPPRGFAYAAFRLPSGRLLMVYTVHLKSNAGGDAALNRAKREEAVRQLLGHIAQVPPQHREIVAPAVLVAGDFNTDPDSPQFAGERTVKLFQDAGFEWALGKLTRAERITWPAAEGFPDATFDHVLVKGIKVRAVAVPKGFAGCSDHRPVVVDLEE